MAYFFQSRLSSDVFIQLNNYSYTIVRNIISKKDLFTWKLGKGSWMNQIRDESDHFTLATAGYNKTPALRKKAHKRGVTNLSTRKALKFSSMLLQQNSVQWNCLGAACFSFCVLARQGSCSLSQPCSACTCLVPVGHFALSLIVASILDANKGDLISSSIPFISNKFLSLTS